ncbi:LamG-like jellyroll fold domain-containing protein [Nonomuraea bangladeshensis]|uniref:LamG-like jellyroll fold domain-containing protein n=1 Tax=Nonomuraea bangladeshensis TaxID=404385 RepID=UPI003C2C5AD1
MSTDPVDGKPLIWTYTYIGDQLVKVCPPTSATACTTYEYGHRLALQERDHRLGAGVLLPAQRERDPYGYHRRERGGLEPHRGAGQAERHHPGRSRPPGAGRVGRLAGHRNALQGAPTSTFVQLPRNAVSGQGGELAVEAWFRTTASGTVIGMQNSGDSAPSAFILAVYVGTDGKLRGQFFTGESTVAHTPIASTGVVNDGAWHHVVLSSMETKPASSTARAEHSQTLYLDGAVVGTLAGAVGGDLVVAAADHVGHGGRRRRQRPTRSWCRPPRDCEPPHRSP